MLLLSQMKTTSIYWIKHFFIVILINHILNSLKEENRSDIWLIRNWDEFLSFRLLIKNDFIYMFMVFFHSLSNWLLQLYYLDILASQSKCSLGSPVLLNASSPCLAGQIESSFFPNRVYGFLLLTYQSYSQKKMMNNQVNYLFFSTSFFCSSN